MPNQAEVIDLRYEAGGATADAVRSANSIAEGYEKGAQRAASAMERAATSHSSGILRVVDVTKRSTDSYLASLERRVQAVKAPLDRLAGEQSSALSRFGGDPKAVDAINQKFATLIGYQKQIDIDQRLDKAAEASKRAAKEADTFQAALVRVNREQKLAATQAAAVRSNVVASVASRVASPADRLLQERAAALEKVKGDPAAVAAVTANFGALIAKEKEAAESAKALSLGEKIKAGLTDPIGAGGAAISGLATKLGGAGIIAAAAFIGIGLAAKEGFEFVAEAGEKAKGIVNLADILGTTVGETQRLDAMAKIASVDIGGLTTFMRTLSKSLVEGGTDGKKGADALRDIGVSARDSQGNLKGTYELLSDIANGLEGLSAPEQVAKLIAIGGRGALALLPLIKNFKEAEIAARAAGAGMNEAVIHKLEEADDKIKTLSVSFDLLKTTLAGKISDVVIPIVVTLSNALTGDAKSVAKALLKGGGGLSGLIADLIGDKVVNSIIPDTLDLKIPAPKLPAGALLTQDQLHAQTLKQAHDAGNTLDNLKTQITDKDSKLKEAESALDTLPVTASTSVVSASIRKVTALRAEDDALKLNLKTLEELPGRQKAAQDAVLAAQAAELTGISRIVAERKKSIEQASETVVDGRLVKTQINGKVLAAIEAKAQAEIRAEQRKTADELVSLNAKTAALILDNDKANLRAEEELADGHLALLESKEVLSRREVENERLRIHKQAIDSIAALDKKQLEDQAALEIRQLRQHQDVATDPRDKSADFARIIAVRQQLAIKTGQIDKGASDAQAKADEDLETQRILRDRQFADQSVALQEQNIERTGSLQQNALSRRRDLELDNLAFIDQQTLAGKLGVEDKRLAIEAQFLKQSETLQINSANRREAYELDILDIQAAREGISDQERDRRRKLLDSQFELERIGIVKDAEAAITSATLKEEAQRREAIIQQNRTVFDDFKRESEGVFDAMFTKGQNIFQAIGNVAKNALLTAFKDVVSSRIAASLTQLVTGQKVTLAQENQGSGPLGKILTALGIGAKPVFGNQPTFTTKLDQPNHLGDVNLVSGAVPVIIQNAQDSQQQQQRSSGFSLPFGLGGATAALAVALGLGGIGAGVAKAAPQFVQSTFQPGGIGESVGPGQIFGGGSILGGPGGTPGFAGDVNLGSGSGGFGSLSQILGGPGGTPGFAGPTGGSPGGFGGILSSLKNLGGFKSILTSLGGIGQGGGLGSLPVGIGGDSAATASGIPGLGETSSLGGIGGGASGIGGLAGGGLLAGGGIAVADGLRRGGVGGLLEDVGGGAAIGAKFGIGAGPLGVAIGAAVGAAAGAIAGTVRLLIKSGADKIISKVKSLYGITVDSKFANDPLLSLIKQNFGGNLDVGLRSPQIRDLLSLYAMSTDQKSSGIVATVQSSVFANQGGTLTNIPNLVNGSPQPFSGGSALGVPSISPITSGAASGSSYAPQAIQVTVSMDGPTTQQFVQGQQVTAIQNNPRAVAVASNAGLQTSAARRQTAASISQPNFITA